MATLALSLAAPGAFGFAAGTTSAIVVAQIGAAVGAYLDATVIMPYLFPRQPIEGPTIGSVKFQSADEGAGIPLAMGPKVKIPAGVLFWQGPLVLIKDTSHGATKGGTGGDFVENKYYKDAAAILCEGPIRAVHRVWADEKTVFNDTPDFNVTSNQISAAASSTGQYVILPGGTPGFITTFYVTYNSAYTVGPDLSKIASGQKITVSGFSHAVDNGTWQVVSSGTKSNGDTFCKITKLTDFFDGAVAGADEGVGATVTLYQKQTSWSTKQMAKAPVFYLGDGTDQPDAIIEAVEGVGNVPAYPDLAKMSIRQLSLFDYGNRLPSFSFFIEVDDTDFTVGSAIARILQRRALLTPDQYDVSACTEVCLGYFAGNGAADAATLLAPLMIAFDITCRDDAGVLVFVPRTQVPTLAIAAAHVGTSMQRDIAQDKPIKIEDTKDDNLPSSVIVTYVDVNKNYDQGSEGERDPNFQGGENMQTASFAITMDSVKARTIASRLLGASRANRQRLTTSIPAYYLSQAKESTYASMTVTELTGQSNTFNVLVDQVDATPGQSLIQIQGPIEDQSVLAGVDVGQDSTNVTNNDTGSGSPFMSAGYVNAAVLNIPALRDEHATSPGVYIAACMGDRRYPFTLARAWESTDSGATWRVMCDVKEPSTMGRVVAVTNTPPATPTFDRVSVFDIELDYGELAGITSTELLDGDNAALLGDEIVQFQDAELIGENLYRITTLMRGQRGTENNMANRTVGETFVLLNAPGVQFQPMPYSSVGDSRIYRFQPYGARLEDVDNQYFGVFTANNVMPFAPTSVTGARDGSLNLTIAWNRRTRAVFRVFSGYTPPLLERTELYDVEIWNSTYTTLKRTFSNVAATTQVYSAANQTTDFGSTQANVYVKIYQRGEFIGRGFTATARV